MNEENHQIINEEPEVNPIDQKLIQVKNLQEEEHKFDITKIVMKENFDIKSTNILKGEQPERTLYFLQLLYKAAKNGKDNSPLIQKYLEKMKKKKKRPLSQPCLENLEKLQN